MKIPFNKPFIVGKELDYINQAVREYGHLSGDGEFTRRCHDWLEKHLGCEKALLTHSCTGALEMAAMLCDIQPGDEIIMPSFTFVSTANAFVIRGGVPVFVDIRPDTLNIDEKQIEKAITPRTKVIVAMHYGGGACNMSEIMKIADTHGIMVVEDSAQALLSTYQGRHLGTIGHLGCLSFHETKNVISGEGGALLVNKPDLVERAEIIREKGTDRSRFFRGEVDRYTWVDVGSSYLPSELVSAFLWAQLEHADAIVGRRSRLFQKYWNSLAPLADAGFFRMPYLSKDSTCNGHLFYLLTRNLEERDSFIAHLKHHRILSVFHYIPLHSSTAGKKYGRYSGGLEVTDDISKRLVRLPLYYELQEDEFSLIVSTIEQFYKSAG